MNSICYFLKYNKFSSSQFYIIQDKYYLCLCLTLTRETFYQKKKKKTRDDLWISLLLVANFHEAALASQSDDGTPLYQCWENWSHHFVLVLSLASLLSQCGQTTVDNTVIPLNTYSKEHGFTSDLQKGTWLYSVWGPPEGPGIYAVYKI